MDVEIVNFPETKVAAIEHHGSPKLEHESIQKLVSWRIENKFPPSDHHRSYGVHYNDPDKVSPIYTYLSSNLIHFFLFLKPQQ